MTGATKAVNAVLGAAVVGLGVVGGLSIGDPPAPAAVVRTAAVQRGDVLATVTASANVSPATNLNLAFTTGGKVTEVDVSPGAHVTTGQILAKLDDTTQRAALAAAQANLTAANARLYQIEHPLTAAQAAANDAGVTSAAQAINNARVAQADLQAITALNATSYQNAVDAAANQLASDQATQQADANTLRRDQAQQQTDSNQLQQDQAKEQQDQQAGNTAAAQADAQAVAADQQRLNADNQQVSADQSKLNTDASTVSRDQAALTSARTAQSQGVARDRQSLDQAAAAVTSAQQNYASTLANNAVKAAPPQPGDLAAQEAAVTTAQNALATAQQAEDGTVLTAPVDGTIGTVSVIVGQTASGGGTSGSSGSSGGSGATGSSSSSSSSSSSAAMTLVDLSGLQIRAGFSETDAAKVKLQQPATVTFPALPTEELAAHVVSVDTTSTLVSNVVTYYVTLQLDNPPAEVKPGMSANVSVVVASASNVLHVPTAAVRGSGANGRVTVMKNGVQQAVAVAIGTRGDDSVEIDSGLVAGDLVVVSAGRTSTAPNSATFRLPTGVGGGLGGLGGGRGG